MSMSMNISMLVYSCIIKYIAKCLECIDKNMMMKIMQKVEYIKTIYDNAAFRIVQFSSHFCATLNNATKISFCFCDKRYI